MTSRLATIFWTVSAALLLLRLVFIRTTMVVDDEAYYLMYARHLDWGYVDHGPVVGWVIKLTTAVFGENGFGIRVGGVLMITLLALALYRFGKRRFSTTTGVALSLVVTANMLTHTNSVVMTPDVPLAFFSILSIMMYYRAFFEDRRHFLPAGLLLGLAMLSKISAVLPAAGIFLYPALSGRHRSSLKEPRFYLSFVAALAVLAPFIVWNARHDFVFFRYQGGHVARGGGMRSFVELWVGLALLIGPPVFYFATVVPFRSLAGNARPWRRFFGLVAAVPLLYFITHSTMSRLELNWPAPALFGGIFLFGIAVGESWPRGRALLLWQTGYSLALILIVTSHTYVSWLPIGDRNDITHRYYDYTSFPAELPALLGEHPGAANRRIVANNYQIPSMINLYSHPSREAICLSIQYHETLYGTYYPDSTLVGEDFVVVVDGERFANPLPRHFESHRRLGLIESTRRGRRLRTYSVWLADGYRGK